eukprot:m.221068 g.221068  ORF g.221068 m.221068 type:complete len:161 (-) comp54161_c0_seq20:166-648(-)
MCAGIWWVVRLSLSRCLVSKLYFTSVVGRCGQRIASLPDIANWDVRGSHPSAVIRYLFSDIRASSQVHQVTQSYAEHFKAEDIVYLTSESPNILTDLDETKVFIIGGIVDHNLHKGLTHSLALEKGVQHARLPIDEVCFSFVCLWLSSVRATDFLSVHQA